ncbi:hypothetical protein MRX96_038653 [Rhipicephalus microplus]
MKRSASGIGGAFWLTVCLHLPHCGAFIFSGKRGTDVFVLFLPPSSPLRCPPAVTFPPTTSRKRYGQRQIDEPFDLCVLPGDHRRGLGDSRRTDTSLACTLAKIRAGFIRNRVLGPMAQTWTRAVADYLWGSVASFLCRTSLYHR